MNRIALTGARIIDGLGGTTRHGTVLIDGEQITAVAERLPAPAGYQELDLSGYTVMPGLIDAHTHIGGGDVLPVYDYIYSRRLRESESLYAYRSLEAAQRIVPWGYTCIRDCTCAHDVDIHLRKAIEEGVVIGPTIVTSGLGITMTGGHVHIRCAEVDGPQEIVKEVRRQLKTGAQFIKIMGTSGGLDAARGKDPWREQFTLEEIRAAVDETHRLGARTAAHCNGIMAVLNAVRAGVDTIEHGRGLTAEAAEEMAERSSYYCPTVGMDYLRMKGAREGTLPPEVQKLHEKQMASGVPLQKHSEVAAAKEAGVKIISGSDCGGDTLARFGLNGYELGALVDCGLSAMDTIVAATGTAAKALGIADQLGSVRAGLQADLIVIDGDPSEDIWLLTPERPAVRSVFVRGIHFAGVAHEQYRATLPLTPLH